MAAAQGKIQEYKKIQSNIPFLTEELKNGIDDVICSLFSKNVIDDNDNSILLQKGTDGDTRPKVKAFLNILMYSGVGAYDAFIETLKELRFTQAVAKLEKGDQQQPKPPTSNTNRDHQIPRMPDMKTENHMNIGNQMGPIYQGCNIHDQGDQKSHHDSN